MPFCVHSAQAEDISEGATRLESEVKYFLMSSMSMVLCWGVGNCVWGTKRSRKDENSLGNLVINGCNPLARRPRLCYCWTFSFQKTYDNLRRFVYRPHISKDTRWYVATCQKCQKNKGSPDRPANPLSTPGRSSLWGLSAISPCRPQLQRHHSLRRQAHQTRTLCLQHITATAVDVAQQFFDNIKLHGLPASVISERDTRFTSRFWQELHKLLNVKLALSALTTHGRMDKRRL